MPELPEIWTGEEELFATLLSVVQEACATTGDNKGMPNDLFKTAR